MAMGGVVPVDEITHPASRLVDRVELPRIGGVVFEGAEKRLDVRIVVLHQWPGVGEEHAHVRQPYSKRDPAHGIAVVGVHPHPFQIPSSSDRCKQVPPMFFRFAGFDAPADDLTTPYVDDGITVPEQPVHIRWNPRDIPREHLAWAGCFQFRRLIRAASGPTVGPVVQ